MAQFSLPVGSARNVILIGDEGVTIYDTAAGGNVTYVNELEWTTPDFEFALQRILRDECKRKPVLFLYDMVEQHYRMERVPKVGLMDKKSVVLRKLGVTFPNHKISAALPLKSQKKRPGAPSDGGAYLFAAVPSSELLSSLIRAVVSTDLPMAGLYLLPVEAVDMVDKLGKKLPRPAMQSRAAWTLLMGQHSNGNLRQVVIRNGELALTRMTPFNKSQTDVAAWVDEVVREFKGSTSYLSRLGYAPDDGIDVIVIGPEEAQPLLEERLGAIANVTVFNVADAAQLLSIKITTQADEEYADILHVSWVGRKTSFLLPMRVKEMEKVNQPRLIASLLSVLLVAGFGYLAYQTFVTGTAYLSNRSEFAEKTQALERLTAQYEVKLEEQKKLGYDIRLFKGAFAVRDELNTYSIKPLKLLQGTGLALGPDLTIDEFTLRHEDNVAVKFERVSGPDAAVVTDMNAMPVEGDVTQDGYMIYYRLTMSFAPNIPPSEADQVVTTLVERLQAALPGYTAMVEKGVKDLSYEVDMEGEVGATPSERRTKEDYVAVIEIRGKV